MSITSETYDQLKIDKLKLYLQTQADRGAARYYEIYVDNLKAVHKTSEINEFDSYEDYMTEDTERIRILVYSTNSSSPRNDQYVYRMKKQEEQKQNTQTSVSLSGIEVEHRIEEKLANERERWEHELLRVELEKTKAKLKEAEDYVEELEEKLEMYKGKKLHWGNVNLGEFASVVIEGIVRRNPQVLAKLPGGEALAGIIEEDNREKATATPIVETEVSFKKKSNDNIQEAIVLTDEEKGYINFMKGLSESFDDEEIIILTQVITKLEEDSTQLRPVAELLNINLNDLLRAVTPVQ
jgi:hypothetical protein